MSSSRLPEPFLQRLCTILQPEWYKSVLFSFSSEKDTAFRLNRLKDGNLGTIAALKASGVCPVTVKGWDDVWKVEPDQRDMLLGSTGFAEGRIYVQNVSSMLPCVILDPQHGDHILDLASAPGSKTIQLAGMIGSNGHLLAVEKVRKRFYKLQDNLRKNGADFVKTYMGDGERIWKRNAESFDRVLLDAPCSSEGRFSESDPETYRYWSMRKIKEMVRKQSRLLFSAVQCLKPGGTLVYSTCTFAPEENEGVVNRLIGQFGNKLEIVEITIPSGVKWIPGLTSWRHKQFDPALERARRILPDRVYEGFFICKIRKRDSTLS